MLTAGIDIGSRTIELVVLNGNDIIESLQTDSGFDPIAQAKTLLDVVDYDRIMATGYGRHLFELSFDAPTVTEIKAYAVGAKRFLRRPHKPLSLLLLGHQRRAQRDVFRSL